MNCDDRVHLRVSVRRIGEDVGPNQPKEGDARMSNLLVTPIALVAGRELPLSALPDAPVVADKRRGSRGLRAGSRRLRRRTAPALGPFAEPRAAA
jgi:hypothetical protein